MKELKTFSVVKLLLFFLIFPLTVFGQVTFNKIPLDKQLVARNISTNKGEVVIEGEVDNTASSYQSIQIKILRNGISYGSTLNQTLNFSGKLAPFSFNIIIDAELANYSFEISGITGGSPTLITIVNEIVAGDVYIIQGQSNAVAIMQSPPGESANASQNQFIRTFGSAISSSAGVLSQRNWYEALGDGDGNNGGEWMPGFIGQFGLKLARLIIDNQSIPIAVFNGGQGNSAIDVFQRPTDYVTSQESNYGRLFYRLNETGLKDKVRGLFWSQGEADVGMSTLDYYNSFVNLNKDWLEDYSNISDFYIFQSKSACGEASLIDIKEAQRRLAANNNNINIMQTAALKYAPFIGNIQCHFGFTNGYEEFAKRIYKIVDRDFYNGANISDIETPIITDAYLSSDKTLIIETNATGLNMDNPVENFRLENAGSSTITDIQISGNKIIFTLSSFPGLNAGISHLGFSKSIVNNDRFITNFNNIELVSFNNFSISDKRISASIWNGSSWSPNEPDATINAIIDGDYNASNGNIIAKNLTINTGVNLSFHNNSTKSVIVFGNLTIDGTFTLGDDESLVMFNDNAIIKGSITKNESSFPRINKNDLTYWSSPITDAEIETVFYNVTPDRIFYYDQSRSSASDPDLDPSGTYWDTWVIATGKMIPAVGYAAEGPNGETGIHNIEFNGSPNNGEVLVPLKGNFNDNDLLNDFNFIGNPYPSAVDIDLFRNKNSTVIDPTIYLWAHNTTLAGEDFTSSNYIAYNNLGGTALSSQGVTFAFKNLHSSQGFFVRALNSGPVLFNNSMRLIDANGKIPESNDSDGDGYTSDVDCDDTNPDVNPGAIEILYNGIDDDCDSATLDTKDADGDGFNSNVDCDDNNANIYPGATEIPDNDIDEDCDGIDNGLICTDEISGKLNIDPSGSGKNIFIMQTPNGEIDINTLKDSHGGFSYLGKATSIKIKPKGQGNKLTVNGVEIYLDKKVIYDFSGDLQVEVKNETPGNGSGGNGHWWITINGSDICTKPNLGLDCGNEVAGDLNIEPKKGKKDLFTMQTPSGTIDMKFLETKDSDYTYSGSASLLMLKVKKKNSSLIVNGKEIRLDKKHRYEFTGELSVSLVNDKKKNGKKVKDHWWISISGNDVCIVLDKKSKHDRDNDDDKSIVVKNNSSGNSTISSGTEEVRDRIWLDLKTDKAGFSQILIGFTNMATDGVDKGYDALKMTAVNNPIDFYSSLNNKKYVIQGLGTFSEEKKIDIGFSSNVKPRTITISINKREGINMMDIPIFLEDHFLGITHELSKEDYRFEQNNTGYFPNRFTLKFINDGEATLDVNEVNDKGMIFIPITDGYKVQSNSTVSKVTVYDLLGRNLIFSEPNSKEFDLKTEGIHKGAILLVEVLFKNGSRSRKKLINY